MTVRTVLYYFLTKTRFGVMSEHGFVTSDANSNYSKEKSFKMILWATKLLHQGWQQEITVSHPSTS